MRTQDIALSTKWPESFAVLLREYKRRE